MRIKSLAYGSVVASSLVWGCGSVPLSGTAPASQDGGAAGEGAGDGATGLSSSSGGGGSASSSSGGTGSGSGGPTLDDAGTSETDDGGAKLVPDAAPPVDLDGGTTFRIGTPVSGDPSPTATTLQGPGLILMGGGTDVDAAFVWMHDTLAGSSTTKMGNVVVFNTQAAPPTIDNAYTPYIFGLAPFQSVQTLYLGGYKNDGNGAPEATVTDVQIAAFYVSQADAVFFAGGDQADYVFWSTLSPSLMNAIQALYARGGIVGGTSAGCAILGPYVFDDLAADDLGADPATADVVKNPYEGSISFTLGMLKFPSIPKVFTDPHFVTRDRFGRLAAFLARQYADEAAPGGVVGVGVDESNALVVDKNGLAHLLQQTGGTEGASGTGAYIIQPTEAATTCTSGEPLQYASVTTTRLSKARSSSVAGDSFDFSKGCGSGTRFAVTVNGSSSSPYSPGPYTATGTATTCP